MIFLSHGLIINESVSMNPSFLHYHMEIISEYPILEICVEDYELTDRSLLSKVFIK